MGAFTPIAEYTIRRHLRLSNTTTALWMVDLLLSNHNNIEHTLYEPEYGQCPVDPILVGDVYFYNKDYQKSLQYYQMALDIESQGLYSIPEAQYDIILTENDDEQGNGNTAAHDDGDDINNDEDNDNTYKQVYVPKIIPMCHICNQKMFHLSPLLPLSAAICPICHDLRDVDTHPRFVQIINGIIQSYYAIGSIDMITSFLSDNSDIISYDILPMATLQLLYKIELSKPKPTKTIQQTLLFHMLALSPDNIELLLTLAQQLEIDPIEQTPEGYNMAALLYELLSQFAPHFNTIVASNQQHAKLRNNILQLLDGRNDFNDLNDEERAVLNEFNDFEQDLRSKHIDGTSEFFSTNHFDFNNNNNTNTTNTTTTNPTHHNTHGNNNTVDGIIQSNNNDFTKINTRSTTHHLSPTSSSSISNNNQPFNSSFNSAGSFVKQNGKNSSSNKGAHDNNNTHFQTNQFSGHRNSILSFTSSNRYSIASTVSFGKDGSNLASASVKSNKNSSKKQFENSSNLRKSRDFHGEPTKGDLYNARFSNDSGDRSMGGAKKNNNKTDQHIDDNHDENRANQSSFKRSRHSLTSPHVVIDPKVGASRDQEKNGEVQHNNQSNIIQASSLPTKTTTLKLTNSDGINTTIDDDINHDNDDEYVQLNQNFEPFSPKTSSSYQPEDEMLQNNDNPEDIICSDTVMWLYINYTKQMSHYYINIFKPLLEIISCLSVFDYSQALQLVKYHEYKTVMGKSPFDSGEEYSFETLQELKESHIKKILSKNGQKLEHSLNNIDKNNANTTGTTKIDPKQRHIGKYIPKANEDTTTTSNELTTTTTTSGNKNNFNKNLTNNKNFDSTQNFSLLTTMNVPPQTLSLTSRFQSQTSLISPSNIPTQPITKQQQQLALLNSLSHYTNSDIFTYLHAYIIAPNVKEPNYSYNLLQSHYKSSTSSSNSTVNSANVTRSTTPIVGMDFYAFLLTKLNKVNDLTIIHNTLDAHHPRRIETYITRICLLILQNKLSAALEFISNILSRDEYIYTYQFGYFLKAYILSLMLSPTSIDLYNHTRQLFGRSVHLDSYLCNVLAANQSVINAINITYSYTTVPNSPQVPGQQPLQRLTMLKNNITNNNINNPKLLTLIGSLLLQVTPNNSGTNNTTGGLSQHTIDSLHQYGHEMVQKAVTLDPTSWLSLSILTMYYRDCGQLPLAVGLLECFCERINPPGQLMNNNGPNPNNPATQNVPRWYWNAYINHYYQPDISKLSSSLSSGTKNSLLNQHQRYTSNNNAQAHLLLGQLYVLSHHMLSNSLLNSNTNTNTGQIELQHKCAMLNTYHDHAIREFYTALQLDRTGCIQARIELDNLAMSIAPKTYPQDDNEDEMDGIHNDQGGDENEYFDGDGDNDNQGDYDQGQYGDDAYDMVA